MLKPIYKATGTTAGERQLAKLVDVSFFGLWSYPSVHQQKTKGGRVFAHEVADLLVLFGQHLIIFSEKDIRFPDNDDVGVAWGRWFRQSVRKSVDQLRGAEACIKSRQSPLYLDAKCTQPFPLPLDDGNLKVHLVAICRNSCEPAKRYFAQFGEAGSSGSSGTLVFSALHREEQMLSDPFWIGDFEPQKTFVHVFDEVALGLLLTELDTGPDFIDYLCVRERAIREQHLGLFYGEEDLLAVYLSNLKQDGFGEYLVDPKLVAQAGGAILTIEEGMWQTFVQLPSYGTHAALRAQAGMWKRLTNQFSEAIIAATVGEALEETLEIHELAARVLASENRVSRAFLGQAFKEKFETVPTQARSARIAFSRTNPARLYIFLLFPRSAAHDTYDAYRADRRACMHLYARAAQYKYPSHSEIVVLAADTKGSEGGSETVIVVSGHPNMSDEEKVETHAMMLRHQILVNFRESQRPAPPMPWPPSSKLPGVNEPCYCGSGRKYKRCCRP